MSKKIVAALAAITAVALLSGCTAQEKSLSRDNEATGNQLERYQANQPVPAYDWSQYRQTVIDVLDAQVHGVATTTFFFNQGVAHPFKVCSSIGFPVPSTTQLTNPLQKIPQHESVVALSEASGVYTGDSSGTYVVCIDPNGVSYVTYWEGFVHTEGGPAYWDSEQEMVVLSGAPTVTSTLQ